MSDLSIEQAALAAARKDARDWKGHAEREAAAMLAAMGMFDGDYITADGQHGPMYRTLVSMLAAAWLQGVNYGAHDTLAQAEQAFERMRDEL